MCHVNGHSRSEFQTVTNQDERAAAAMNHVDPRSKFQRVLADTSCIEANYCARELNSRTRSRCLNANTDGRFVNVTGGTWGSCQQIMVEMCAPGFKCKVSPGPLLRPSHHKHTLHQPVSVGNMSKFVKSALKQAHINQLAKGCESVLDVKPGVEPKWGTHSCRRGGAKRAGELVILYRFIWGGEGADRLPLWVGRDGPCKAPPDAMDVLWHCFP